MLCCDYCSRISILLYTCMCALCCSRANKDATPTTPASKGASRKSRIAVPVPPTVSEPESSENEGTTPKTTASPSHIPSVASHTSTTTTTAASAHHQQQQQQSNTPLAATDQLEKSDRISKEKQKFFRLSAIFADKKRAEKKKEEAQRQTAAAAAAAAAEISSSRTCRSTNKSTVIAAVEGKVSKTESTAVYVSKRPTPANRQTRTDTNVSDNCKVVHKPSSDVKTNPSRTSKLKSNNNKVDMNKDSNSKAKPVAQKASVAITTTAKTKSTPKSVSKQAIPKSNDKKSSVVVPAPAESSSSSDSDDDDDEEEDKDGNSSATTDSSEECSSSSGDESTSSDSDSDSSNHQSETSRMSLTGSKLKLPSTMYVTSTNPSMGTFGSISGISSEKDKIWGFAAAAAEANKKTFATNQDNHTFGSFSEINSNNSHTANGFSTLSADDKNSSSATTSSTSSNDRHKPGFGQLKGLFDGLSHLFTTPDHSRSRAGPAPNYSLSRRKRAADRALSEKEQPPKKIPEVTVPVNNSKTDKPIKQTQQPQQGLPVEVTAKVTDNNKSIKNMMPVAPKPENAVGIASIVTKQSNITIPPKIPKRIAPNPVPPSSEPERKVPRPGVFLPSSSEDELHPSSVSHHAQHSHSHQHNHHHHHHLHHQSAPHVQQQQHHPWIQMTPSNLVKTAVNSKRHEFERRRFLKGEAPYGGLGFMGFSHCSFLEDVRMKKRNLIAEATQTNHPLLVPEPSNNQTGKMMGHRTLPQPIRTFR